MAINAIAAVVCAIVVLVFAVAEFTQGAWVVVVVMPILIYGLMRTNAQYRAEDAVLDEGAALEACEAPVLRHHMVIVLVDRIDLATARAIQYARTLTPDELRAVHFNIDEPRARAADRPLAAARPVPAAARGHRLSPTAASVGPHWSWRPSWPTARPKLSMLLPRRSYGKAWRRILHDQTADRIVDIVSQLPHVNATIVPFNVAPGLAETPSALETMLQKKVGPTGTRSPVGTKLPSGAIQPATEPIVRLQWRTRAKVAGR